MSERDAERDEAAGDRGGAGAAVGLQHLAVDPDRPLAEGLAIDDAAQGAADQALDLHRAAGWAAPVDLALRAGVGRGGDHGVLGRDPALAGAVEELGHAVVDAGVAEYPRVWPMWISRDPTGFRR